MQGTNEIGVIKNWNMSLNNSVCLILEEKKYSKDIRSHFCKVLIEKSIYTIPRKNIELLS
jgi:hypothetical protein